MASDYLTGLAYDIYLDLGSPSGQSPAYIQAKLASPAYVGKLNNLISTCYVAVTGNIDPDLGETEQGIYQAMYEADYYTTKLTQVLAGLAPGVVELREGDRMIRFTNPVEQAKVYKELQRQLGEQLFWQVSAYRGMASQPSAVDLPTIVNFAKAGYGYGSDTPYNWYRS